MRGSMSNERGHRSGGMIAQLSNVTAMPQSARRRSWRCGGLIWTLSVGRVPGGVSPEAPRVREGLER